MVSRDTSFEDQGASVKDPPNGAQSVRRSFQLLKLLADATPNGLSLTEIGHQVNLAVPTIHRMLKALVYVGAAEQLRTKRYVIGRQIPLLASGRPIHLRLIDLIEPYLLRGSQEVAPVAWLSHRTNLDATCDARMTDGVISGPLVPLGSRRPLGMPAASLAMLLELEDDEADTLLRQNRDRLSHLEVNPAEARRELQDARRRRFVLRERGRITGLTTVSLAIKPSQSRYLAALTVAQMPDQSSTKWIDRAVRFLHESRDSLNRAN